MTTKGEVHLDSEFSIDAPRTALEDVLRSSCPNIVIWPERFRFRDAKLIADLVGVPVRYADKDTNYHITLPSMDDSDSVNLEVKLSYEVKDIINHLWKQKRVPTSYPTLRLGVHTLDEAQPITDLLDHLKELRFEKVHTRRAAVNNQRYYLTKICENLTQNASDLEWTDPNLPKKSW